MNTFKPARSSGLFQVNLAHNNRPLGDKSNLRMVVAVVFIPEFVVSKDITSLDEGGGRPSVNKMTFMTSEVMDAKSLNFMETNTMFCIVISSNS